MSKTADLAILVNSLIVIQVSKCMHQTLVILQVKIVDQSIADQNDDDATLPESGSIGIVHPAHLDAGTRSAWGEILADYGIIPPFQQLGR